MAKPAQISNESILEGLEKYPQATAAELAQALGIGKSTATRYLAALELDGKALRTPGGWKDGKRFSDRWSLVTENHESPGTHPTTPATAVTGTQKTGPKPPATTTSGTAPDAGRRLGKGALGALVLDYLGAHPSETFGPAALAKVLERSGGAISNALAAMAVRGEVVLVSDKPRRYRTSVTK